MKFSYFLSSLRNKLIMRVIEGAARAPFEPILHASTVRIKYIGFFALFCQPFFGAIWAYWIPQPYENMIVRCAAGLLGIPLMLNRYASKPDSRRTQWLYNIILWVEMPIIIIWLYKLNEGNMIWLASLAVIIVLYYQVIDWRIATGGLIAAFLLVFAHDIRTFDAIDPGKAVVIAFSWVSALTYSISGSNLRRKRLEDSLATMGIVAHELRTPLATLSMLGDAIRNEASNHKDSPEQERLENLSARVYALARSMNQQIDTQIANTSLLHLSSPKETVLASNVINSALGQYPFRSQRERQVVTVNKIQDFSFESSHRLFVQVLINLIQNAFRAVVATQRQLKACDIQIEIDQKNDRGYIKVIDQGTGIRAELLTQIFEPFFSTQAETGHGLGLAFCRRVVTASAGRIHVQSSPGKGTTFIIELRLKSK